MPKKKLPSRYDDVVKRPGRWSGKKDKSARKGRDGDYYREDHAGVSFDKSKFTVKEPEGYCVYPVGGDTYSGCNVSCSFCFTPMLQGQHNRLAGITPNDPVTLFKSLFEDPEIKFIVNKGIPVQLGCLSDPFPIMEPTVGATYELLKLLATVDIGTIVTTKHPELVTDRYLEILKSTKGVLKVSMSSLDENKAKLLEPGALSPLERIEELRRIRSYGVPTVIRFAPWIHKFMPYDYKLIREAVDAAVFEVFRYAVTWRSNFPMRFWEAVYGETAPGGEQRPGTARYEWGVEKEKEYFSFYRYPNSKLPYYRGAAHHIVYDDLRMREIMTGEFRKVMREAGVRVQGLCMPMNGIRNIDINSAPYCCAVGDNKYDDSALVPQWHLNQWADYVLPDDYSSRLTALKILTANDVVPLIEEGGVSPFVREEVSA